jgi:hypothetical protein
MYYHARKAAWYDIAASGLQKPPKDPDHQKGIAQMAAGRSVEQLHELSRLHNMRRRHQESALRTMVDKLKKEGYLHSKADVSSLAGCFMGKLPTHLYPGATSST